MHNLLLAYWRHCHYDVTPLRAHTDRTADSKSSRHAWTCLPTMGISIHCNIRIDPYTLSHRGYINLLLVSARTGVLPCFVLQLPTLYFYF